MQTESMLLRLEAQIEIIPVLLSGATRDAIMARPPSGQWSAYENLAHLARYHEVFLDRVHRIQHENAPQLERYRAEEDSEWPKWSSLSLNELLIRLTALRREIINLAKGLSEAETQRVGFHPLFGEMRLGLWVEFFLLHEAHHLYVVMTCLGQAKRSLRSEPS